MSWCDNNVILSTIVGPAMLEVYSDAVHCVYRRQLNVRLLQTVVCGIMHQPKFTVYE